MKIMGRAISSRNEPVLMPPAVQEAMVSHRNRRGRERQDKTSEEGCTICPPHFHPSTISNPFLLKYLHEIRAGHLIHRMSTTQVTRAPAKVKVRLGGRGRHERGPVQTGGQMQRTTQHTYSGTYKHITIPQSHGNHAKWIIFTLIFLVIQERNGLTAHFFRCSVKLASCCGDVVAPRTCPWAVGPRTALQLIYLRLSILDERDLGGGCFILLSDVEHMATVVQTN